MTVTGDPPCGPYATRFMEREGVVLLASTPGSVTVATSRPLARNLRRLLEAHHCAFVHERIVSDAELTIAIQRAAAHDGSGVIGTAPVSGATPLSVPIDGAASDIPVVNLVNSLLNDAVRERASDIHVEAHEDGVRVRYRVDGALRASGLETSAPLLLHRPGFARLAARLKVLAGLNATERRRPQDGRFTAAVRGDRFDVRLSAVPTIEGESLVLRLFRRSREALALEDLGMPQNILGEVRRTIRRRSGLLLIAGPTGSGKTTTLHAALAEIGGGDRKVITIEDPVEYRLRGAEQIQTNEATGMTFETILRRVLRQDPDVIMVGELRDPATAELLVRAALTGHLVLATVHSRTTQDTPDRLASLGVGAAQLALVAPTLLAQRLVRVRCPECGGIGREPGTNRGIGCRRESSGSCGTCGGTGFFGRTGLFEIGEGGAASRTLAEDGARKAADGVTTGTEVAWALGS